MTLSFVHMTDHHLGAGPSAMNRGYATGWALERLLEAIAADDPDVSFLLCTGDLVDEGTDVEFEYARRLLGLEPAGAAPGPLAVRRPGLSGRDLYVVPGNHDDRAAYVRALFPATQPTARLDLHWRVGGVSFVYLDLGLDGRRGDLRQASLDLLECVLQRGDRTVIVLHHHPVTVGVPWLDRALPEGIDRLWALVARGDVAAVVFGHAHATVETEISGVPVLGLRSTCFQFAPTPEPVFTIQPLHYRLVVVPDTGPARHQVIEVPLTGPARGRPAT